jgi:spermidine synthase
VIAWRDTFMLPPDGPRLQVLQADGAEYLEAAEKGIDVLLVDAFDKTGFAPSLANREFFESPSPSSPATASWSSTWPARRKATPG